jgi:hypothetical protein
MVFSIFFKKKNELHVARATFVVFSLKNSTNPIQVCKLLDERLHSTSLHR